MTNHVGCVANKSAAGHLYPAALVRFQSTPGLFFRLSIRTYLFASTAYQFHSTIGTTYMGGSAKVTSRVLPSKLGLVWHERNYFFKQKQKTSSSHIILGGQRDQKSSISSRPYMELKSIEVCGLKHN